MWALITKPIMVGLSIISGRLDLEYWCKWILSYVYIKLLRLLSRKRLDLYDMLKKHDPYKVGFLPPPEEVALESPLPEEELLIMEDEMFFYGMNSKSECLCVRVSRQPGNESNAWSRLRLADGRSYEMNERSGFQQSGCDKRVFSCGDLQMHYISPMRRWRIFFNGLMREKCIDSANSKKMVYVKFALLWQASSKPFDFTTDISTEVLASGLAGVKWNQYFPPLKKLYSTMNVYVQTGAISGTVTIDGDEDSHKVYLFGEKMRFLGDITTGKSMNSIHILGRTEQDGRVFHIIQTSASNIVENLQFGFIVQPNGDIENISSEVIVLKNERENDKRKVKEIEAKFQAGGDLYEMNGALTDDETDIEDNCDLSGCSISVYTDLRLNCLKGNGVILKREIKHTERGYVHKEPTHFSSSEIPFVVPFSDKMCQDSEIAGGKGSSLGKLTKLSKKLRNFIVSDGIVVTTAAYEKFLTREALQEIETLEKVIYNDKCTDIKEACQKVIGKVLNTPVPENVQRAIAVHLQKLFPSSQNGLTFAVRSSATGEDTEQMSAAGQMDTYLGVRGMDEIVSAVKKCWASQFSHIAVQYKRQNGQLLNSPMAVVIQRMVSCDVAGVLFTCGPLTGNPARITITANYGLGEAVVSGSVEPDTIELIRYEDGELAVMNKTIGSKSHRVVIKAGEGTNLEDIPNKERTTFCLSDEMALRLGEAAVKIQKYHRSHRDIEWGLWNNNLYIFQSRPVTSGTEETDFEIDHEHDAALRIENEYFTVCNVGELSPGAMSPLGLEVLLKFSSIVFQGWHRIPFEQKPTIYFPFIWCSMYNHLMFNCINLFKRIQIKDAFNGIRISLFGRLLEEEELFEQARLRYKNEKCQYNITLILETIYKAFYLPTRLMRKCQKTYIDYRLPHEECKTSQELFELLMYSCTDLNEVFACHMACSGASSMLTMKTLSVLASARGELNSEVYADLSKLLKTCSDVESADVPAALEELSFYISKDIKPQVFKKMNSNEALKWLQSTKLQSGLKYREFLLKHGHRCVREADIRSGTWQTDPIPLIQILQNMTGNFNGEKIENSSEHLGTLLSNLQTKLDFKKRLLLKMLIPMSQKAVKRRECSKSLLIRALDGWRKGYTRLSQMMVREGRIPDSDLLFFMTLEEIRELLHSRSSRIIAKANHRRRRYPILDQYIFPEISKGFPIPVNSDIHPIITSDEDVSMKGIPVSQGVTKGFARVAITLEEASLLQVGEILVTYSTDIGWTPYFPFLSGVATELGGLISHGAVVSREYGLPCVAGLHGATRMFQTGDYVLLDGNKGILKKLSKKENL